MAQNSAVTDAVVIVSAARTPMGGMMGSLSEVRAPDLCAVAIKSALERGGVTAQDVDEVVMGCVLPAGLGQAPARQAARKAGIPDAAGATTVNKMCGSGMKAVMLAHDQILAGSANIMLAGGMENMSQAPYLLPKARAGLRMGHGEIIDHMFFDGLEDAYEGGLMGSFAQKSADDYQVTREAMDDFAIESLNKANAAIQNGEFVEEIAPVKVVSRRGELLVDTDEQPGNAKIDKIRGLKPAFKKDGTVTAANSSSISDGGSALLLMRESEAKARGLTPLARIVAHSTHAQLPAEFTIAPIGAIEKVLSKAGWDKDHVDLFEINEAFAVVTMLATQELGLDVSKVNVRGGACALGHPIGSSGSRILVTLLYALKQKGLSKGVASLCIGGGEATAVAVEML
ncbi:MAG TPA: acetyl-CoA C-acetyltransferase [Alteromonas australica]|mgnify:CR=1 FL=1|uniref:Acetyl-CoA C-acetyltransferase n=2 Tax=Alteromonadales TaxID=135622 RepID=A0A350P9T2_9ALTE|nr:acetyl-CoA C-acyltransferase [Alteromonas macleodii]MAD10395.1 acetyl-CoA C-acyltransferase [Alteromonas sp.]HAI70824.1 acetyl-CoA C-acetyltransferase [Alteromonas australica]HAR55270.1 acetyl-CoA C-acetyltransferase [Idiomarina baltica]HAW78049.1 acetyl-CoA C-acetyltransferase [Alteromonas australica]|tara:strand:- start:13547 stop:14743 length:1197 start_codon:yes stop_codon:yes gene_type:complete